MRVVRIINTLFWLVGCMVYAQDSNTLYMFVDNTDSLVQYTKGADGAFSGYKIVNDARIVKRYIRPSTLKGEDKVVEDYEAFWFTTSFLAKDTVVTQAYLDSVDLIKDRERFLKILKEVDENKVDFKFIEPLKGGKYVVRKLNLLIQE